MADTKIVHTSANRGTTIDYTWNMKGNHIMKLAAIAATTNSNARQYDFFIDGQSFFNMPKVRFILYWNFFAELCLNISYFFNLRFMN